MPSLKGAWRRLCEEDLITFLSTVARWSRNHLSPAALYDTHIRPFLPRRVTEFNDVRVRGYRVGDRWIPWQSSRRPQYETALVRSLREHVRDGDRVVVVGGGWGVTAAVAAMQGESVAVQVFEGGRERVERTKETAALNNIGDNIEVTHAVVGASKRILGDANGANRVSPNSLPPCDVLEIDAEGAELSILSALSVGPRVIIVETHGSLGSPTAAVRELVEEQGYRVVENRIAEEGPAERDCRDKDIRVLVAVRN